MQLQRVVTLSLAVALLAVGAGAPALAAPGTSDDGTIDYGIGINSISCNQWGDWWTVEIYCAWGPCSVFSGPPDLIRRQAGYFECIVWNGAKYVGTYYETRYREVRSWCGCY